MHKSEELVARINEILIRLGKAPSIQNDKSGSGAIVKVRFSNKRNNYKSKSNNIKNPK